LYLRDGNKICGARIQATFDCLFRKGEDGKIENPKNNEEEKKKVFRRKCTKSTGTRGTSGKEGGKY